ncbi:MAG: hypothetical protein J6W74_00115 [Bacteroidales bacterium]|nr:hypothetical protein [Bacteroidales bacterium]
MKNKDIVTLCNGGFLAAAAHSLPVEHFYKFCRFKREVAKAVRALADEQSALMKECGIDPGKFDEAQKESLERYAKSNGKLLEEETAVAVKARIPLEFYKGIYDENKGGTIDIFANNEVEELVLDNLFLEAEE